MKADPDPGVVVPSGRKPVPADVFMSYAREDRAVAEAIAAALERHGLTVWWDRKIVVGRSFSEIIERELAGAKCVVVLWSRASVASEWVSNEAAEGVRRQILVPICVEDVIPPLEFRRRQTAHLFNHRDLEANAEFPDCLTAIRTLIAGEAAEEPAPDDRRRDAVVPALLQPRWLYAAILIVLIAGASSFFVLRPVHEQPHSSAALIPPPETRPADPASPTNPYPFAPAELFEYRYPAGGKECKGYFLSDGAGRWAERTFGKDGCIDTHYEFREQTRRAGEALLFDSGRGYYVRIPLQGGQSFLATSPAGPWGGLHELIVSK
jgi:hypothetical protein